MRIEEVRVSETPRETELSARAGDFRLWFRFSPGFNIIPDGDPFLAAFLLPAMLRGESLEIDPAAPVSERLFNSAAHLQTIFHCWNPAFQKIPIQCRTEAKRVRNEGVASFYSRGVDSNYTFLTNRERITHLISVRGFDFLVQEGGIWEPLLDPMAAFAQQNGKGHVRVATNILQLVYPVTRLGWGAYFGSVLVAIGLALGFRTVLIAAGHTYSELIPSGSHALTDRIWSTEATTFIHSGAEASRSEKIQAIAADPKTLDGLWVCWEKAEANCGRCSKCVRTRIALRLLGIRTPAFPEPISPRQVRSLSIVGTADLTFFFDNMNLAGKVGDRRMQNALRHCIRKYELRKLGLDLDKQLFRGALRRAYASAMRLAGRTDPDRHDSRVGFLQQP